MKKTLALILALAMVFALCLTGCGGGDNTANTGSANTGSAENTGSGDKTPADDGKVYTLRFSAHDPETSDIMVATQAFFDEIEKVTDGHVKVEGYYSAVLAGVAAVGDMVSSGGVDMGWVYTSYYPTQFTLSDVITLPMQGFGDNVVATNVLWDLYETVPEMAAQWDNEYKVLQLYANPAMKFMFNDKITSVDQIKGKNIRVPAGAITDVLAAWGAAGVTMGPPDIYEAMEKKNVDGYIFEEAGCNSFTLYEVTPYYLDMPMFVGAFAVACNWDSWNALPAEYQEAIEGICTRENSLKSAEAFAASVEKGRKAALDAGKTEFITPTDDEIAGWAVEGNNYASKWCENIDGSGVLTSMSAADYLQNAKDLYAKYAG